jgi:hypothetical protein
MQSKKYLFAGIIGVAGVAAAMFGLPTTASASSTVVVTSGNTQGWSTADTRPGGAVDFILDPTAHAGSGALQLTTDATTSAKAQYLHGTSTPLDQVTELGYWSKQNAASFADGAPSYQLAVDLDGPNSFTTLVYEPYQNGGTVTPGAWQQWDVDAGLFWSSRTVACSNGTILAGGGGAPFYTLEKIKATCPEAVAVGFGVNIGSNNPSYDVEADLVSFNDTMYDFEPTLTPATKDDCKRGGWASFNTPAFKNQGDCVSYIATGGKA